MPRLPDIRRAAVSCMAACLMATSGCSSSDEDAAQSQASSASSSSAASSGAGGSGGPPTDEACANGSDDDQDGDTDCADSDCVDWACAEAPPSGWVGPFSVYRGPGPPPECAVDQVAGFTGFDAPPTFEPAECSCRCLGVVSCSGDVPAVQPFSDGACATSCGPAPALVANACVELDPGGLCGNVGSIGASGGPVVAVNGCAPSQTVTKEDPEWQDVARGCIALPPGKGCGADEVCAPHNSDWPTCIAFMGEAECPPGSYSEEVVLYGPALEDTRDCTECSCSPGCPYRIDGFGSADCSDANPEQYLGGACETATNPAALRYVPLEPTCDATAGRPIGTVEAVKPATFCCTAR